MRTRRRRPAPLVASLTDATAMNRLLTHFRELHPAYRIAGHRIVGRFVFAAQAGQTWVMVVSGTIDAGDGEVAAGTLLSVTDDRPVEVTGRGTVLAIRSERGAELTTLKHGVHELAGGSGQLQPGIAVVLEASPDAAVESPGASTPFPLTSGRVVLVLGSGQVWSGSATLALLSPV